MRYNYHIYHEEKPLVDLEFKNAKQKLSRGQSPNNTEYENPKSVHD